jgi:hypothetical protein
MHLRLCAFDRPGVLMPIKALSEHPDATTMMRSFEASIKLCCSKKHTFRNGHGKSTCMNSGQV